MPTPSADDFHPEASPDDQRPGLPPPQFGMRTLLAFVSLLCCLLALSNLWGLRGTLILLLFGLSVAAHFAASMLGHRLRENGRAPVGSTPSPPQEVTDAHFAPTTQLSREFPLGVTMLVCVAIGVVAGGALGGWLLALAVGPKATWANMSIGVGAFGVLGGLFGFLSSSFLRVLVAANLEAWKNARPGPESCQLSAISCQPERREPQDGQEDVCLPPKPQSEPGN